MTPVDAAPGGTSLFSAAWRKYREAPLVKQFEYEWYAFGVLAFGWGCFCIGWAVAS